MKKINVSNFTDYDGVLADARAAFTECKSVSKKTTNFTLLLDDGINPQTLSQKTRIIRRHYPAVSIAPIISETPTLNESKWAKIVSIENWYDNQQAQTHTDSNGDERSLDIMAALLHFAQLVGRQVIKKNGDSVSLPVVHSNGTSIEREQGQVTTGMAEYLDTWEQIHISYIGLKHSVATAADIGSVNAIVIPE